MDPISTAIVGAIANLGATAVKDAYDGLKSQLVRKFGEKSKVVDAVRAVEVQPESEARQLVLAEEVAITHAMEDEELLRAAKAVGAAVEIHGGPAVSVRQIVHGNGNIFSGTGNVSTHHHRS